MASRHSPRYRSTCRHASSPGQALVQRDVLGACRWLVHLARCLKIGGAGARAHLTDPALLLELLDEPRARAQPGVRTSAGGRLSNADRPNDRTARPERL